VQGGDLIIKHSQTGSKKNLTFSQNTKAGTTIEEEMKEVRWLWSY
jgi:hypothetical protein